MKTSEIYASVSTESLEALPVNPGREYLFVQNQDATAVLAVNFGRKGKGSGTLGMLIQPGQYLEIGSASGEAPRERVFMSASAQTNSIYILEGVKE